MAMDGPLEDRIRRASERAAQAAERTAEAHEAAATEHERHDLVTRYGADSDRIEVVPPGVDHKIFCPGDRANDRRRLGLPLDAGIVLFAGRIQPLKGADLAVRALRQAHLDADAQAFAIEGLVALQARP